MGSLTNYPNGVSSFGIPIVGGGDILTSGKVFWVDTVHGKAGNPGTFERSLIATDAAVGKCTANNGDHIFIKEGSSETFASAAALAVDVAGITIIGLGEGAARPQWTFSTLTTASALISANNVSIGNIVGIAGIDGLTAPFNVTGDDCTLDIEWHDTSSLIEAATAVRLDTANNAKLKLKHNGFTAGNATVRLVAIDDCDNVEILIDAYGVVSTAWVNMVDVASTNVKVDGRLYTSGVTDFSRLVVDTITGSTWDARIFDASAGFPVSGGSGAAFASDDASAIAAQLTVPTADATTNANSRDVVGNKTDAGVTAVGTTKSIVAYLKGLLTMNTVQTADATSNAFAGDIVGNKTDAAVTTVGTTKSIIAYVKGLVQTLLTGASADSSNNASLVDVIGNKTDASVFAPSTTKSLAAYAKGNADLQERVAKKAAAVMVNGDTLFTIAGGPIQILGLISICETGNNGTASTLQYNALPTVGAPVTISAASASLANAPIGSSVALQGTALATAALYAANGPTLIANPGTVVAPAGQITAVIGVGSTTGTWSHYLRYRPLAAGVTVS